MGEGAGDVQRPVGEAPANPGAGGRTGRGARPGIQPRLIGCRSDGWTTPKDATANIFFINIFYFLFLD